MQSRIAPAPESGKIGPFCRPPSPPTHFQSAPATPPGNYQALPQLRWPSTSAQRVFNSAMAGWNRAGWNRLALAPRSAWHKHLLAALGPRVFALLNMPGETLLRSYQQSGDAADLQAYLDAASHSRTPQSANWKLGGNCSRQTTPPHSYLRNFVKRLAGGIFGLRFRTTVNSVPGV